MGPSEVYLFLERPHEFAKPQKIRTLEKRRMSVFTKLETFQWL